MKKFLILPIIALCAANFAAAQNAPEKPRGEREVGAFSKLDPETRIQLMKRFDKNGDGRLDAEERKAAIEAMKDKVADLENLRRKHVEDVMKRFDKDGDGKLNAEERRAMFEEARQRRANLVKKYDKDGDGVLNDAEREELIKDPEVKDMMKRMLSRPFPPPPPNRD